jgi:hypothetical protein
MNIDEIKKNAYMMKLYISHLIQKEKIKFYGVRFHITAEDSTNIDMRAVQYTMKYFLEPYPPCNN